MFKIIGYPADFGKKTSGQNFKKQGVFNNNSVGKSSSSGFTDEQMATLISFIKDNKGGKNVQANMIWANQHMTYTDKELVNVIDISYLKIKVGHPNGTEAYISKIGNLRLSNGLTLHDVMVIPEYYVTLISVHKLVKENKIIVAFDENRCYFLTQDLNLKNVIGIGKQCEDPVLNVLKDSLNFDKRDNTGCCEIFERAKQTREPFPLSDHNSKNLEVGKNDSTNVLQDVNHINFFDIKYLEIPNDDERVANDLNKCKSDSSSSSEFGSNINTADFPVVFGNDADYSNDFVATQNEEVATLKDNVFSEDRYKARLVAQDFEQKKGIDYEETFSPIVKMVSVRCLFNIVVSMYWPIFQLDVNNAFLYGDLEEVVYMKPPEGYFPSDNKSDKGVFLALLVYVDDIIITSNSASEIEKFKLFLKYNIVIKDLGKLLNFLGIEVVDTHKGIYLNQRKYVLDMLSEYGMLACKPAKTHLLSKLVISNEASDKDPLLKNITDYQKLLGKLIYLTNTRPDISYVVHCLSQFMHSPLTSHLKIAFKILRYLKSCPVSWKSKKQNTLSKSSTEAEYRAFASVTSEVIWILNFLKDLEIENLLPVSLHCDSNSAIKIDANPVFHERTKHLEIDLHFIFLPKGWIQFSTWILLKNWECMMFTRLRIWRDIENISLNRLLVYIPTSGIRAKLGPVVVWMVFPRLDLDSTLLVDPINLVPMARMKALLEQQGLAAGGDLAAIDTAILDKDQALLLLTSLPSSDGRYNHKKSQGFFKNEDQVSSFGVDGYDNADVMMAMSVEELSDWIMDSRGSYHMLAVFLCKVMVIIIPEPCSPWKPTKANAQLQPLYKYPLPHKFFDYGDEMISVSCGIKSQGWV
nr:ribonuclease H-like domain-containing protein [Tanacetum cinerariifolium]